jgi:V8-like Glu-specific endopeptidase
VDNELEVLRQSLDRILARDKELAHEIESMHPQVTAELPSRGEPEVKGARAAMDPATLQGVLETIVKKRGRPVLAVRRNDFVFEPTDVESEVWRRRLSEAHDRLRRCIPAVGRVDLVNDPSYTWVGTAWLVQENIAVTNRHVAEEFAFASGDKFVFRTAPGLRDSMAVSIDFLQEAGESATRVFTVLDVLHIEPEPGPDLAFLRVQPQSGSDRLADPIPLARGKPQTDQFVAAIGYPARDSRVPDQALVTRIFGDIYDKKRLAPGALLDSPSEDLLAHDCSTLGGNSGSVVLNLATGEAVGLHRAGLYLQANYAVPAALVDDRLTKLRTGRLVPVTTSPERDPGRVVPVAQQRDRLQPIPSVGAGETVTWTIPLSVTVQLGQPTITTISGGPASPARTGRGGRQPADAEQLNQAVTETRRQLTGLAGVVDVRAGYQFRDGWITDERAVVVAVRGRPGPIPSEVLGVPVEVTPASPWDLLRTVPQAEALERVPAIHYKPPPGAKLKLVDEEMRVLCHVSPDAGWPTLQAFLGEPTRQLTVGIYDFTAPHVVDAVKATVKPSPHKFNLVIRHNAALDGDAKKDDIPNEKVVSEFKQLLKSRFKQAWASTTGPHRLFASAYHIKVAVRDGEAFWLSSGNWQSSNQPEINPVGDKERTWGPLRSFNREWHAVVENAPLAAQFEKFLLWDLEQASEVAEEAPEFAMPMVLVSADAFVREAPEPEAAARVKYFPPLEIQRQVRVQPLLTPDNFQAEVLKLIRGARQSICFQNQSLNLLGDNDEDGFRELVTALLEKQQELGDVRIILRGDFNPRPVLEKLKDFGFDMNKVRAQKKCHTKGIVVDSARVVLGSHNWTNQGTLVNRDASLIFFDEEIAGYYRDVFEFDWKNLAKPRLDLELPEVELVGPEAEVPEGMVKVSLWDLVYGDG